MAMRKQRGAVRQLSMRGGGLSCLILMLGSALAGCEVAVSIGGKTGLIGEKAGHLGERTRVVRPQDVAGKNDPDWRIQKEPARSNRSGSSEP